MQHRGYAVIMMAVVIALFSAGPACATPKLKTLEDAVAYVKQMSKDGKPRSEIAAEVTKIVDDRVYNVNSWERVTKFPNYIPFGSYFSKDEDNFDAFRQKSDSFDNDVAAQYAWNSQYGQCEECACLSYYLLTQAGVEGNVRIFSSAEGSSGHNFVVWGVEDGANPNDPSSWGSDAYVVDGWQGLTLDKDQAAANKHVSNSGAANIADRTKAHDKTASVWQVDESSGGTYNGDDCLMEFLFSQAPGGDRALTFARGFRDEVLSRNALGRSLIAAYYELSASVIPRKVTAR